MPTYFAPGRNDAVTAEVARFDRAAGDLIALSWLSLFRVEPPAGGGRPSLQWSGDAPAPFGVWCEPAPGGGAVLVRVDTDGDAKPDAAIRVNGVSELTEEDFADLPRRPRPRPSPTPPAPVPAPAPAPAPVAPEVVSVELLSAAEVPAGAKARYRVRTRGMPEVRTVMVRADWTWRDETLATAKTAGEITVEHAPLAAGEFLKALHPTDPKVAAKDGPGVKPAAPPAPAPAPVPPAPSGSALERVRRVIAPWRYGINVERGQALWNGWITDDTLRHYAAQGVTHVRYFAPSGGRYALMNPNDLGLWIDACRRTVAAGMAAHLDFLDVVGLEHLNDAALNYVRACARKVREAGLDPARVVVGAVNEYAGGDSKAGAACNTAFNGWRTKADDAIHAELPDFVVATASGWWGHPDTLMAGGFALRPDKPQLIQWHCYEPDANNPNNPVWWQGRLDKWAKANGAVTYGGEFGIGPPDNSNGAAERYADFPKHILNAARGMGQQRPAHWTVTDGSWWRVNEPGSGRLRPEIAAAIKEASAHIARQDWYLAEQS